MSTEFHQMDEAKPKRTVSRICLLWGCALGLLTLLGVVGLFWASVLAPAFRAGKVIENPRLDYLQARFRKAAVAELGGPENAANAIAKYLWLGRGASNDQSAAVWLLAHCEEHGVPLLIQLVEDGDETKRAALSVLEILGPKASPAAPLLGRMLDDPEETQGNKMTAIQVLREIGPLAASEAPRLRKIAEGKDDALRPVALYALIKVLPADDAVARLFSIMKARISQSRVRIDETWRMWRYALRDVGEDALPGVMRAMASSDPIERLLGLVGLNAIRTKYSASIVRGLADAIKGEDHTFEFEGKAKGKRSLRECASAVFVTVCIAHGNEAIPQLKQLMKDESQEVRAAAKEALDWIQKEGAQEAEGVKGSSEVEQEE